MIQDNFKQSHFIVYELVLPYCTVCTPRGDLTQAWHTPVTCEESSDAEYSLWFTKNSSPIMQPPSQSISVQSRLNSSVWRVVSNATETTPKLNVSKGMASRGTMSVTLIDFDGDPGPIEFSDNGTFFGKLKARNVLDGKKIISHYYTITDSASAPIETGTSTHYIENMSLTGGKATIKAKDALKDLEAFSQKFPIPTEVTLAADIDSSTTTIPVSDGSKFSADNVVIIDKELMRVQSVSGNNLTVYARGATILATDSELISKTEAKEHSIDSAVQICYVMNKTFLSVALQDIFNAVGLSAYVDFAQWDAEILEWNKNADLYGVFYKPESADDLINHLLTDYMIEMWLDQPTQKAVVSATTAWKQAIRTITEDTDFTNLRSATKGGSRFSRAYIRNKKDLQAENDDPTNYSQLTLHKDTQVESDDFFGDIKIQEFDASPFITPDSATILVSRFVQRFSRTPAELSFTMEERKLAGSKLGDIVDIVTRDSQTPSGEYLNARVRSQLIEIKPNLNEVGRTYNVKALSYVPLISSDPGEDLTIFIGGKVFDINLYARAGGPPVALNITFVFDAATIGSTSTEIPAIRAGEFAAGTNIRLIFINNSKVSSKGGDGGAAVSYSSPSADSAEGVSAGYIYDSEGVQSELYINYTAIDGYTPLAEVYAASGGGGGAAISGDTLDFGGHRIKLAAAAGGGGGYGIPYGDGGVAISDIERSSGGYITGGRASSRTFFGGVTAIGGAGAVLDGVTTAGSISDTGGNVRVLDSSISAGGSNGGAIKGANVTVYNLAAEADKFKPGNSDPFTLITA